MSSQYPETKQSNIPWIGDAPIHWQESKFKFLLNEKKKTQNLSLPAGSISFGTVVEKDSEKLMEETLAAYQELLSGEFIINPLNLNFDLKSLRTALSDKDVVVSSGYIIAKSTGVVDTDYLRWLLHQFDVSHMKTLGAGIRQTINFGDIANSKVLLPPQREQRVIAQFLNNETQRVDSLIREKQNFINLIKEKRQALISHVVTKGLDPDVEMKDSGVEWIGEIPKHWDISKLKYEGNLIPGYSFNSVDFCDKGTRVVKISNIQHDHIDWTDESYLPKNYSKKYERFLVKEGDIVFALTRPIISTGIKASLFPKVAFPALLNQRNAFLRPHAKNNKIFLYYLLFANYFLSQFENSIDATGQQPNISTIDISRLEIVMPPKSEQDMICAYLQSKIDSYHSIEREVEKSIELLKEHRTALISAAITGKIDLRNKEVV